MKNKELEKIFSEQPSVSKNTLIVGISFVIFGILFLFFLFFGIALWVENWLDWKSVGVFLANKISINDEKLMTPELKKLLGNIAFLLSFFNAVILVCLKLILRRNHFILLLEDWGYGTSAKERK